MKSKSYQILVALGIIDFILLLILSGGDVASSILSLLLGFLIAYKILFWGSNYLKCSLKEEKVAIYILSWTLIGVVADITTRPLIYWLLANTQKPLLIASTSLLSFAFSYAISYIFFKCYFQLPDEKPRQLAIFMSFAYTIPSLILNIILA